jgi:hypothetical protein
VPAEQLVGVTDASGQKLPLGQTKQADAADWPYAKFHVPSEQFVGVADANGQ